ncbi:alginate export family protein [Microbulbifer spongiae]|uniref:Alginate export family protein n=1 Tax=Microbulbifer spongiae TaxID=2944933 RepID=A0ABY9EAM3_9GAMM|nr:alginate export family protein [Microbulbifer sp. MI-G]WKD50079.1 alginate export family protein [Microbulbifer sp. MI-G]
MTTHRLSRIIGALLLGACSTTALQAAAQDGENATLTDALKSGEVGLNLRYRVESVDQENLGRDATASTLRTRLNWRSGSYRGFDAFLEMDDVTDIGNDNFNSTVNGKGQYPVIADPSGTEVNQAYLRYRGDNSVVTAGRQRINLDNQRFVGGVAWRQNEQTYDGVRYQYGSADSLQLDYSYIYKVNRIFGEDSVNGDFEGDIQLFHAAYPVADGHSLTGFLYNLDLEDAVNNSSRTYGLDYKGTFGPVKAKLSYARQTDIGDSPLDYSANYYLVELATALGPVDTKLGYEVLGSDNGVGFKTPLATLHKFQGFTDQFLATPGEGIEDLYIGGATKIGEGKLSVNFHNFKAHDASLDYGNEWNITYSRKITKEVSALIKYATYDADEYRVDTDKVWLMLTANF